jgi:hypothetical protein
MPISQRIALILFGSGRTTHTGIAPVDADLLLNLIANNQVRIPKLLAA